MRNKVVLVASLTPVICWTAPSLRNESSFHFDVCQVLLSNSPISEFPPKCQMAGGGFPGIWRFSIKVCGELRVTCCPILHSSECIRFGKQCVLCAVSLGRPIISLLPAGTDLHMGYRTRPSLCVPLWRGAHCVLDREKGVMPQQKLTPIIFPF